MKIPNIDGTYQTKDKRVVVVVNRKEITLEFKESETGVHIIDEDDKPRKGKGGQADGMDKAMNIINKTSKILLG